MNISYWPIIHAFLSYGRHYNADNSLLIKFIYTSPRPRIKLMKDL